MEIYFRQHWIDKRLSFNASNELVIGANFLQKIWLPDTFIGMYLSFYLYNLDYFIILLSIISSLK